MPVETENSWFLLVGNGAITSDHVDDRLKTEAATLYSSGLFPECCCPVSATSKEDQIVEHLAFCVHIMGFYLTVWI